MAPTFVSVVCIAGPGGAKGLRGHRDDGHSRARSLCVVARRLRLGEPRWAGGDGGTGSSAPRLLLPSIINCAQLPIEMVLEQDVEFGKRVRPEGKLTQATGRDDKQLY